MSKLEEILSNLSDKEQEELMAMVMKDMERDGLLEKVANGEYDVVNRNIKPSDVEALINGDKK